ncbi:hypothetical protein C7447_103187 [Tenacibaculum adriaticum]|uniref:Uncharacterized protein n=1 Tax=Tenacibaculum adriaticum TaxID=413713 RepID=A0A5S5DTN7_9FLAO|nr:hypothetical protein [Tenacibaculum adriaticum]TYP98019.1 hypothetical protein C7447_103187 [Tenacibaculum adriaticum]
MKRVTFLLLFVCSTIFAQKNINNYKYIIVPEQFEFLNQADKYQTSSLTKFLFNKYGFTAFLSNESFPDDLSNNRCIALTANVKDKSGMFTTKSVIELRDCFNKVVYTSSEGKSKNKEYKKAYQEAIREAFNSVKALGYKYVPFKSEVVVKGGKIDKKEGAPVVGKENVIVINQNPVTVNESVEVLYAQVKENGFQLVNTKPEVVFEILNTNVKDVFIIKNKNGILYKNNTFWTVEFYQNGNKTTKEYKIKF